MTKLVVKGSRARRTHSEQFKQDVVEQCIRPGMSLANVARQHELHPNLLSRWVKERTGPAKMAVNRALCQAVSSQSLPAPQFVPVHVQPSQCLQVAQPAILASKLEVNLECGELRIQIKVDPSQMTELGQMLRQVLR